MTLTGPGRACISRSGSLALTLSVKTVSGKARFTGAQLFLDRGAHVVRRHTVQRHGRKVVIKTSVFVANKVVHTMPANLRLPLGALKSGGHTVRAVVTYMTTVHHKGGGKLIRRVSKTLRLSFDVC